MVNVDTHIDVTGSIVCKCLTPLTDNTGSISLAEVPTVHYTSLAHTDCGVCGVSLSPALQLADRFQIPRRPTNESRDNSCRSVAKPVFCRMLKTLSC